MYMGETNLQPNFEENWCLVPYIKRQEYLLLNHTRKKKVHVHGNVLTTLKYHNLQINKLLKMSATVGGGDAVCLRYQYMILQEYD